MSKVFKYVVARPWDDNEPDNLCIYAYCTEVQKGTMEDAESFLAHVKARQPDYAEKYAIYKVNYTKV